MAPERNRAGPVLAWSARPANIDGAAGTETLRAHNEGRKVFCRQVGITRVRWLIADDERTCPICRPLDGKVFGIDSGGAAEAPGMSVHLRLHIEVKLSVRQPA